MRQSDHFAAVAAIVSCTAWPQGCAPQACFVATCAAYIPPRAACEFYGPPSASASGDRKAPKGKACPRATSGLSFLFCPLAYDRMLYVARAYHAGKSESTGLRISPRMPQAASLLASPASLVACARPGARWRCACGCASETRKVYLPTCASWTRWIALCGSRAENGEIWGFIDIHVPFQTWYGGVGG